MFVDFTLAEFADAAPTVAVTGRMKKATTRRWDKNGTSTLFVNLNILWLRNRSATQIFKHMFSSSNINTVFIRIEALSGIEAPPAFGRK